jgi:hypothetical protein
MPGWRSRKVDCTDGSMASDVAAAVVSLFGHVHGVERTVGDPGVGDTSSLAAPRGLTRGQRAAEFSGAEREFFWAKAQRISANGGDACGCRNPFGGVVMVILPALRLRVKTLDLAVSTAPPLCVVTLLGASSWSPDTTWYRTFVFVDLIFLCFLFFIFDLLCKRFSSSPCISLAVVALFIKRGENLFRENLAN